eukprot:TRINITY_DN5805_c0_g1_i2.p2 TRINITY_DN5805_c0_g1~~TRINITY_DN5805_c0_g1_i2.p2  ORF type:complete len:114 (+),score=11.55 TRINITY_DN5805_c0_g1_i2:135-476(+)
MADKSPKPLPHLNISLDTSTQPDLPIESKPQSIAPVMNCVDEVRVCEYCQLPFKEYDERKGIGRGRLVAIIVMSVLVLPLLLFIWCCKKYKVCPNCGNFAGLPESKDEGTCLC